VCWRFVPSDDNLIYVQGERESSGDQVCLTFHYYRHREARLFRLGCGVSARTWLPVRESQLEIQGVTQASRWLLPE
jgi:hypothetical protein